MLKQFGTWRRKAAAAAAMTMTACLFAFQLSAAAYWQNEQEGPGVAVWVEENAPGTGGETTGTETDSAAAAASTGGQTSEATEAAEAQEGGQPPAERIATPSAPGAQAENQPVDGNSTNPPENQQAAQTNLVQSNGRQLDLTKPMIALTYDDGPYAKVGNRIMDVLEQYGGRATFFMVGERVPSYPEEVRRMVTDGHEVANHTQNHQYLNKLGAAAIQAQVQQANDVIQQVSGVRPTLMRLPGGNKNQTVLANVGMPMILWSIDTRDWATRNRDKTVAAVLGKVQDGDIVLMHELYTSTAEATEALVPQLTAQGYQLVTVSELAKFRGKELLPHQVYYRLR